MIDPDIKRIPWILLSCIFLIVSCAPRPLWLTRMIYKPTCYAPCWENITPGKTTKEELSRMINQGRQAFNVRTGIGNIPWGETISWCEGSLDCGRGDGISTFIAFGNEKTVQEINLDPGVPLFLTDFSQLYGEPEELVFSDTISAPGILGIALLYPKIGLVLEFSAKNLGSFDSPSTNFQEDLRIYRIIYSIPNLEYYFEKNIISKEISRYEWKGYTHYP
jgi:hypothetical protein